LNTTGLHDRLGAADGPATEAGAKLTRQQLAHILAGPEIGSLVRRERGITVTLAPEMCGPPVSPDWSASRFLWRSSMF
jgi:hypothetical protein